VETWKLSTAPQFIAKVRDVVGFSMSPPENALVLCVDEKWQIQALDRTAPCLPMLPTTPARMTHDYVPQRHDQPVRRVRPGQRIGDRPALPAAPPPGVPAVPQLIDSAVPKDLDLHLVLDSYATHKTPAIHQWLLKHPRFYLHFTPTSSSWMNLAERWFAELTNRKLRRSAHRSVTGLETDIRKWTSEWNKDPKSFVWTKTADEILETLAAYCRPVSSPGR
jgi:transposase